MVTSVWSTSLVRSQKYSRSKAALAVFSTSGPSSTQTVTVWSASSPVAGMTAVLVWSTHSPATPGRVSE